MTVTSPIDQPLPIPERERDPITNRLLPLPQSGLVVRVGFAACVGYVTHLFIKYFYDGSATAKPYVLQAVYSEGILYTIQKVCAVGAKIFGEPSRFMSQDVRNHQSGPDRLRSHFWRFIGKGAGIQRATDSVISKLLRIRPYHEMPQKLVPDPNLKFLEIARLVFWEQVGETAVNSIAEISSINIVTGLGYTLVATQSIAFRVIGGFFLGMLIKIADVYNDNINLIEPEAV